MINRLAPWVSPGVLLLCGIAVIPPYVLQRDLLFKAVQLLMFMILCLLAAKRLRLLGNLVFFAAVVVFHVLTPTGRVLFSLGRLAVTETALKTGALKALTFVGLYYLSAFTIDPQVRFPGRFGYLLSRTLGYFHLLFQGRRFDPRRPVESLDELLLQLDRGAAVQEEPAARGTSAGGYLLVIGIAAVSWCLVILTWTGVVD
jgi:heptaprenyl diphosphate synthase